MDITSEFRSEVTAFDDLVVISEGLESLKPVLLVRGGEYSSRNGRFYHDDLVGKPFGSVVKPRGAGGRILLLKPTPELWTESLPTRTQIVRGADIAHAVLTLALRPGSTVVESGTGSGSMTTSLARAVAPGGRVLSYEFNAVRAETATEEFARNRLSSIVRVQHADAVADGFPGAPTHGVDGVFLDLPSPWDVVHHVVKVLRAGGRVCSYSPCIEQVQKMCIALRAAGFEQVETRTTLLRTVDVHRSECMPCPLAPFGEGGEPEPRYRRSEGSSGAAGDAAAAAKRPRDDAGAGDSAADGAEDAAKRAKPDTESGAAAAGAGAAAGKQSGESQQKAGKAGKGGPKKKAGPLPIRSRLLAPTRIIRGHTAYLTTAILYKVPTSTAEAAAGAGGGVAATGE